MILSEVKRDKKHLYRITTEEEREFFVDVTTATEYCLKAGDSITEEKWQEILHRSDFVRAKERALWYLDRSDRSEKALYEKLVTAGFKPTVCAEVMAWLKEYGMVDDVRYATRLSERFSESNVSKREAYNKLLLKGIPRDIAREVTLETEFDESAQIRALIEKKYKNKLLDKTNVEKVYAALIRKGFSFSAVREQLKKYSEELEYSEE